VVPTIECAHYSRLRLLNETIDRLQHCYHLYRQTNAASMTMVPEQSAMQALSRGLEDFLKADHIRNRLATVRDKCLDCKRVRRIKNLAAQNEDGSNCSPSDDDEDDLKYGDIATLPPSEGEQEEEEADGTGKETNTRQTTGTHNKGRESDSIGASEISAGPKEHAPIF